MRIWGISCNLPWESLPWKYPTVNRVFKGVCLAALFLAVKAHMHHGQSILDIHVCIDCKQLLNYSM